MPANIDILLRIKEQIQKPLRKVRAAIKKLKAGIKRNPIQVPVKTKSAMGSLQNLKSFFIGSFAAGIIASSISVASNFETSMSTLSSLTGSTGKDLQFFRDQAKEIGATTTLSASQAADAFTIIGSKSPELLKSKEALAGVARETVVLAEAAKIEMPQAAQAVTGALNQFELAASKTSMIVDTLAAGSKAGAADVNFLNAAIEKSGAAASDAGVGFQDTVAAIETIAPKVTEASTAGLNFKNIMLELGTGADKYNPQVVGLRKALDNLAKDGYDKAGDASEKFGKVNVIAATALIKGREKFSEYAAAVRVSGVALEQQRVNTDNTAGSIASFKSRIESLQIAIFEQSKAVRGAIDIGADFVAMITENLDIIGILIGGFVVYKLAIIAATVVNTLAASSTGLLTMAQVALNTAMKANPIGFIVAGITLLVAGLVLAWNKSEIFRATLFSLWEIIKTVGSNVFDVLAQPFLAVWDIIMGIFDIFSGKGSDRLIEGIMKIGKSFLTFMLQPLLQITKGIDAIAGTDFAESLKNATGMKDITEGVGDAAKKGFEKGIKDFRGDDVEAEASLIPSGTQKEDADNDLKKKKAKSEKNAAKVTGDTKVAKNITINIGKLNESINITAATVKESTLNIEKEITDALIKVVRNTEQIA